MHVKIFYEDRDRPNTPTVLDRLATSINAYARKSHALGSMTVRSPVMIGHYLVIVATFESDPPTSDTSASSDVGDDLDLRKAVAKVERDLVTTALARVNQDVAAAAKLLGISERALHARIKGLVEGE